MAIAIVYTEEQLLKQLEEMIKNTKKGGQICSALIEAHTHEIEITYGLPSNTTSLIGFIIKDRATGKIVQDHNGAKCPEGTFQVTLPKAIPINAEDCVTVYGCGSVINGSFKFKTTDFSHSKYTVGHYTDRIMLLNNWGYDTVQVDVFPTNKAVQWVMDMQRNNPQAFGLFVTRDLHDPALPAPPFFISFK